MTRQIAQIDEQRSFTNVADLQELDATISCLTAARDRILTAAHTARAIDRRLRGARGRPPRGFIEWPGHLHRAGHRRRRGGARGGRRQAAREEEA